MINSKNKLKEILKSNKNGLVFETIMNIHKPQSVGIQRKANIVQSNAFTLLTEKDGQIIDSWIYLDSSIKVKNNIISYLDVNDRPFIQIRILEVA